MTRINEIEYGSNILKNPGAEDGTLHWTTSGVTITSGGVDNSACFELAPVATMEQNNKYLAFVVQPATFKLSIHHKHTSSVGKLVASVNAFCTLRLTYEEGDVDNFMIPLNAQGDLNTWVRSEITCDIRMDSILQSYTVVVNNASGPAALHVDDIKLLSGVDGLNYHNADDHPHNLPLSIAVNQQGIKATKGTEVQFWLTDEGDAIFKGEISAAQISIGKIKNGQIDIEGLDLMHNPTFSSIASNVTTIGNTVSEQATAIQQNAEEIVLQARSINERITTVFDGLEDTVGELATVVTENNASINIRANGIESNVSSLQTTTSSLATTVSSHSSSITQLSNNINLKVSSDDVVNMLNIDTSGLQIKASNIDLMGITTMYDGINPSKNYLKYFGNGIVLYENGIKRMSITATDYAQVIFKSTNLLFEGSVDFSLADIYDLEIAFS